jgi:hypothetical protein
LITRNDIAPMINQGAPECRATIGRRDVVDGARIFVIGAW